mmetsp:Transcript_17298/g.43701  ORF Transcript_17298/g.43701 Transcript_17298/m.43701 type:complete len:297 (-) Transcript_17298:126-1016(-)
MTRTGYNATDGMLPPWQHVNTPLRARLPLPILPISQPKILAPRPLQALAAMSAELRSRRARDSALLALHPLQARHPRQGLVAVVARGRGRPPHVRVPHVHVRVPHGGVPVAVRVALADLCALDAHRRLGSRHRGKGGGGRHVRHAVPRHRQPHHGPVGARHRRGHLPVDGGPGARHHVARGLDLRDAPPPRQVAAVPQEEEDEEAHGEADHKGQGVPAARNHIIQRTPLLSTHPIGFEAVPRFALVGRLTSIPMAHTPVLAAVERTITVAVVDPRYAARAVDREHTALLLTTLCSP